MIKFDLEEVEFADDGLEKLVQVSRDTSLRIALTPGDDYASVRNNAKVKSIDGGDGCDVVRIEAYSTAYTVQQSGQTYQLSGNDLDLTLRNVEILELNGRSYDLTHSDYANGQLQLTEPKLETTSARCVTQADDYVQLFSGDHRLSTLDGDDTIVIDEGSIELDTGSGLDAVLLPEAFTNYSIRKHDDSYFVQGRKLGLWVKNAEHLSFQNEDGSEYVVDLRSSTFLPNGEAGEISAHFLTGDAPLSEKEPQNFFFGTPANEAFYIFEGLSGIDGGEGKDRAYLVIADDQDVSIDKILYKDATVFRVTADDHTAYLTNVEELVIAQNSFVEIVSLI